MFFICKLVAEFHLKFKKKIFKWKISLFFLFNLRVYVTQVYGSADAAAVAAVAAAAPAVSKNSNTLFNIFVRYSQSRLQCERTHVTLCFFFKNIFWISFSTHTDTHDAQDALNTHTDTHTHTHRAKKKKSPLRKSNGKIIIFQIKETFIEFLVFGTIFGQFFSRKLGCEPAHATALIALRIVCSFARHFQPRLRPSSLWPPPAWSPWQRPHAHLWPLPLAPPPPAAHWLPAWEMGFCVFFFSFFFVFFLLFSAQWRHYFYF